RIIPIHKQAKQDGDRGVVAHGEAAASRSPPGTSPCSPPTTSRRASSSTSPRKKPLDNTRSNVIRSAKSTCITSSPTSTTATVNRATLSWGSVSIDCDGQGVQVVHAVADDGVTMADVVPPDVDVPPVLQSFFLLDGAINYDGRDHPLLAVQVTDLADGVFVGFSYNHALSDGTAFWGFINAWAEIARARLLGSPREQPLRRPLLDRWSPDGGAAAPVVLPCTELSDLIERTPQTLLRERMLHFSSESLAALKERARQELLATGDAQGAAALTRFQALTSLLWRCITRARRLSPEKETTCRVAINNRGRLRPQLPAEYFGNAISTISTEAVRAPELLERGHGWAAAAVGRAVAAHTDAVIRERVAALTAKPPERDPPAYMMSWHHPCGTLMGSSPRFDMFGCDFGWGKPVAARSGKAKKVDGGTSLYPCPDGGGSMDAELTLTPEHMAVLEEDEEFWAAVSPDAPAQVGNV
uniref:Acetyltransferase n=2 Tax=Aegilops tauschii subsp. strangulata TaxID=200361 RepID=A0A453TAR9_AEGTS